METYQRPIDEKATKEARKRHAHGERVLQSYFRLPYEYVRWRRVGVSMHHSLGGLAFDAAPWRSNPNCPRPRAKLEKARHLRRKRARAARRCGR